MRMRRERLKELDTEVLYKTYKALLRYTILNYRTTHSKRDYEEVKGLTRRIDRLCYTGRISLDDYERLQSSYISNWTKQQKQREIVGGSVIFHGQENCKRSYPLITMLASVEERFANEISLNL